MLPKKTLAHKKSLGSIPTSNTMSGFSFGSKETIKGHSKHSSQTFNRSTNVPSLNESLQKSSSPIPENRPNLLVKDILEAKEIIKDNKAVILNELPAFLESCKQELGTLATQFDDQVKRTNSPPRNIQGYAEALQKQIQEKEKVNQDLLEANKVLAQKNESLSNMLATTTDQLGMASARDSSRDRLDDPMKYTRIHSKKLAHESKSISIQIEKAQMLNPYNSARIKAQVGQLREYAIRSHRDRTKKSQSPEDNENKNSETSRTGKMLTCESARTLYVCQSTERQNQFKIPFEEGDEQMNVTWNVIHRLVEDLEAYKKAGFEENRKYVEAMRIVEEAAKEKESFLNMIRKYDELLNENETTMRNSRRKLKELNMLLSEANAKIQAKNEKEKQYVGAFEELEAVREDLEELKEKKSEVEEEYKHAKALWRKKEQLLAQEKEQVEKQLESTKSELMKAIQDLKMIAKRRARMRSKERAAKAEAAKLKQVDHKQSEEVEMLKKELDTVKKELEIEKARHSVKLKIHEENYSKHLETIAEMRYKIEELTGACEQLRKSNTQDCETWRMVMKERYSIENPEELFVKYEENENNLKMYMDEKDDLLREINKLKASLEEKPTVVVQEKQVIVETFVEAQTTDNEQESKTLELQKKLVVSEKTLSQLQQQITLLNQEKTDLASQCENYQNQLDQEKHQSKEQEELLTQYEGKVQELRDQLDESMEIITNIKQQLVSLEKEKNDLAVRAKEDKSQPNNLNEVNATNLEQEKLVASEKALNNLQQKQIALLNQEKAELTAKCEKYQSQLEQEKLQNKQQEELLTQYEVKVQELKSQLDESMEIIANLEQQLASLEKENNRLTTQAKEDKTQPSNLKEENIKDLVQEKLVASEKALSSLQQQITSLNQEKTQLAVQCENYQNQLEQEKHQSKQQEELLTQSEAKVQELKNQLDESMKLITSIKQQLASLEKEKNELAAQAKENRVQSSKPGEQNKGHESARNSLNEVKIKDLERKLQDSIEGANQLKKQIAMLEDEKAELLEKFEEERILQETTVAEYEKKVKELEHDLGESIELGTHLEKQVETLEKEKKELKGQNDSEKSKVKELEEKIENIKKESKAGDEGKLKEAEAATEVLKEKLALVEKEKEKYLEEIKKYKTELNHMEVKVLEMDAAQANWDDARKHLEENMAIVKKEKQDLFKKTKEYQDIIEDLKTQLSDLHQQKQTQRRTSVAKRKMTQDSEGKDSNNQVEALQEQIKYATEDYEELKNEKELLDKLIKIERERSEDLERKVNKIKEEYENRIEEYRELLMEFKDDTENQKGKEEELANRCTQLQAICDDFELKCEILGREKEDLERDLEVCKQEKKDVQRKLDDFILGGGFN